MSGEKKETLVYVKDPEYAWVPATLVSQEGDKATVSIPQYKDEQSITSDGGRKAKGTKEAVHNLKDYPHKVLPLQNVDGSGNLLEFSDMVKLPYLHEVRDCLYDLGVSTASKVFSRLTLFILFHLRLVSCTT